MKKTLQTKDTMAQSAHRRPIIALWSVLLAIFPIAALVAVLTVGHLAAPKQAHAAAISGPTLTPGQVLHANDYVQSNNGQYKLLMQGDGNLVLYTGNRVLWNTATGGNPGAWAVMQGDGNFVVYSPNGAPVWNSATGGNPGAQLVVQDDSNLVVYSSNNTPLWFSGVLNQTMISGQALYANQYLQSHSGQYKLIMQGDGNLVLYTGNRALWNTATGGNPGAWAVMQGDGNLVVYSASGAPLWNAATGGKPGAYLAVQDDSNLVVYSPSNTPLWNSGINNQTMISGQTLYANQYLQSDNGQYKLIMQGDGNLVLYVGNQVLWNAATGGNPGAWAVMQGDGNFVVYSASGAPLWNAATGGKPGAYLAVQDDSNVMVYSSNNTPLWFSGTNNQMLKGGQYLYANQYLQSHSGQYKLIMQGDGNLVLYSGNQVLWNAGTGGKPGAWAVMQSDGNLVIYNAAGQSLWQSGTAGNAGAYLVLQDDGNLVVYTSGGAVWASGTVAGGRTYPIGKTLASNPFANGYSNQCTYYAEERMYLYTGVYMDVTGNAYQWAAQASSNGWTVGTTPAVNSVVVFPSGSLHSSVGHVAWVIQVNGSSLLVQDYNWNFKGAVVTTHWLSIVPGTKFIYP